MCGISFTYRPEMEPGHLYESMKRSVSSFTHRGPDGCGQEGSAPWAMGNRRLSIIDLPGSSQPLSDHNGRFYITYNGELYNYLELKKRIGDQWDFRTMGDTEVVLAGLVIFGTSFLSLMEGMWALALWDSQKRELLIVRDRMGKRPLYYQDDPQRFACASELQALKQISWSPWQEDLRSTADYLRYGYFLPGTTAYNKVREVLPGHWLRWSPGRGTLQKAYWRLQPSGYSGSRKQAVGMLRDAMVESVRHRLVADVEVGALLSGGVDSSLVVSIATRMMGKELKTFSMGFDEPTYDERSHALRMARHCQTDHLDDCLTLETVYGEVESVLKWTGQPFADGSILPTYAVCGLAADHVKVVLSGDGGDELFSGYQRYLAHTILRWYTRLPCAVRGGIRKFIASFPEPGVHHSASFSKKAHLFLDLADRQAVEWPYVAPTYYALNDMQALIPEIWHMGHPPPKVPETTTTTELERMMTADALIYLPQDILAKVDRAGMAHSLEVRAPFLDQRVVELAFSLPGKWHRTGWTGKRMLFDTFSNLLPKWTWQRRKHGFGIPVHVWFRTGLQKRLSLLIEQTTHPLNQNMVHQMIADHLSGRKDHGQRLWQLFIYLLWRADRSWQIS